MRPHLLIVSDDPDLQAFLAEGLIYAGFWVSVIASAVQTLEVFRLRTFDLVLIDAALAGLNAIALVRRLRGVAERGAPIPARTDAPILLIAARPEDVSTADATAAGADGVLYAPLELADLGPLLHETITHWRATHPDRPWADAAPPADG